jgi:hypothetical protein
LGIFCLHIRICRVPSFTQLEKCEAITSLNRHWVPCSSLLYRPQRAESWALYYNFAGSWDCVQFIFQITCHYCLDGLNSVALL